jgi:hypothetical protein
VFDAVQALLHSRLTAIGLGRGPGGKVAETLTLAGILAERAGQYRLVRPTR